jgi:RNA-directed DNA polymerase
MKTQLTHSFEEIISLENLLEAWKEFECGKKNRKDVQEFSLYLMDNIFLLHNELLHHTYKHGGYQAFKINDPKPRDIHKATVRDRLLHHAIYRKLYPFFEKTFIADSYSCQKGKGTHKAINRFRIFAYKVGKNNTKTCWALKCDIRKFFANIDHEILLSILKEYISDENILWLLENIIDSFKTKTDRTTKSCHGNKMLPPKGLPLGNLTSQLFVNVYMNKFDQFAKHKLKARYYIRYADDFVFLSEDKKHLENLILKIQEFMQKELKLELHSGKVFIKALSSGVDFLGWVNFANHRVLRTSTKKRMLRKLGISCKNESLQSYLGLLKDGNTKKIKERILEICYNNHII